MNDDPQAEIFFLGCDSAYQWLVQYLWSKCEASPSLLPSPSWQTVAITHRRLTFPAFPCGTWLVREEKWLIHTQMHFFLLTPDRSFQRDANEYGKLTYINTHHTCACVYEGIILCVCMCVYFSVRQANGSLRIAHAGQVNHAGSLPVVPLRPVAHQGR